MYEGHSIGAFGRYHARTAFSRVFAVCGVNPGESQMQNPRILDVLEFV